MAVWSLDMESMIFMIHMLLSGRATCSVDPGMEGSHMHETVLMTIPKLLPRKRFILVRQLLALWDREELWLGRWRTRYPKIARV